MTMSERSKLLLLVKVGDDCSKFAGTASIDVRKNVSKRTISCVDYFQLKCSISDVSSNRLVTTGVARGAYPEARFKADFKNGNGGF